MTAITIGQRLLLLKGKESEFVSVRDGTEDHQIMEDMVTKGWFNRAFISGGKTMYNLDGGGFKIVQKLAQSGF